MWCLRLGGRAIAFRLNRGFLHLFAKFVVSTVRYFFACTKKTHKHMHIVIPENLADVHEGASVCGMAKHGNAAAFLFC